MRASVTSSSHIHHSCHHVHTRTQVVFSPSAPLHRSSSSLSCQSSPQRQRCCFQIPPLPPLIKAAMSETHLYSWRETMLALPPWDWFSPLKQPLCLKPLHRLCYAKQKMEDFQFNLGWTKGWSAVRVSIVLLEPIGTFASPKRQLNWTERRAEIIDRQEKGGVLSLSLIIEKENQREGVTERRWSVG